MQQNIYNPKLDGILGALKSNIDKHYLSPLGELPCLIDIAVSSNKKLTLKSADKTDRKDLELRGLFGFSRSCPWDDNPNFPQWPAPALKGTIYFFGITKKRGWVQGTIQIEVETLGTRREKIISLEITEVTSEELYQPDSWPEPDFLFRWAEATLQQQISQYNERLEFLVGLHLQVSKPLLQGEGLICGIESIGYQDKDDDDSKRSGRIRKTVEAKLGWKPSGLHTFVVDFMEPQKEISRILTSLALDSRTCDVIVVYGSSTKANGFYQVLCAKNHKLRGIPILRAG